MFHEPPRVALHHLGVDQSLRVRFGPASFVALVLVAGAMGFWAVAKYHPWGSDVKATDVLTATIAVGAFLIGFSQWRSAREETSLERFYDRLKLANDARVALSERDQRISPMHMYVYVELDNLEYVLQKYRLGYMAPEHALRGVNTFDSRRRGVAKFEENLRSFGDLAAGAGYQQETSMLVQRLLSESPAASDPLHSSD